MAQSSALPALLDAHSPAADKCIGKLASTGVVTPSRWGRTLGNIAAASPACRAVAIDALERAIAVAEPRRPQDLLALLELLETLLLDSGTTVGSAPTRAALQDFGGSSKTASTARRLLAIGTP